MGTSATFEDEMLFADCVASVRNDSSDDVYVIVNHPDKDPLRINVLQKGEDLEEIVDLLDDEQVMYILARYKSTFDMSTTVKFVFFRWHGDKVQFTQRGKYGVVFGSIKDRFNPFHHFFETSSRDDFQQEKVIQQIEETTGMKSKVIENTAGCQQRGFTATQLPNRAPVAKTGPQISSAGAAVKVMEEVPEGISMVRGGAAKWMLAEYMDNNSKGPIIQKGTGEGDIEELKACLEDDRPMYGLYRVTDVVDDIPTVKFAFITWVGERVKPMMKAKLSTHKGVVEETFGPFHVTLYATILSEITEEVIIEKVTSASGSKSHVK